VSDGQGDRLRSLTQGTPQWQIQALAQDLTTGGLSALASDGTNDYAYLQPGDGQAPLAGSNQQTGQTTYLATALGGSVRVATNAAAQVIGAGAYDAWGNPRPTTPGSAGATQLAGLQGATPFGYAGQYRDAGAGTSAGTYDLRAREYDPATGRFLSVDPLLDQTGQPYLYAGDNPVDNTDPSGQCTIEGINLLNIIGDVSPCSPAQQDSFLTGALRTPVMSDGARPEFSVYTPSRRDIAYLYQQALRIPAAAGLIRAGGNAAHGDHGFRVYGVKGTVLIDDANVPLPGPDSLGDPIRSSRRCGGGTASTAWDAAAQTVQGVQGVQGALDYGAVVVGPTADRPAGALIGVLGRAVAAGVGRLTIGKLLLPVAGIAFVKAIPFFIIPTPPSGNAPPSGAIPYDPSVRTIGRYRVGSYDNLRSLPSTDREDRQAHHIIQNATVMRYSQGGTPTGIAYSRGRAPAILLIGSADSPPPPPLRPEHYNATRPQRNPRAFGIVPMSGNYGIERQIGQRGLENVPLTPAEVNAVMTYTDEYFVNELGFTRSTPTDAPGGNQRRP